MKRSLNSNIKLLVVIALSVLVVGMLLFGFFGFNKTVEGGLRYELTVSVDQNVNQAGDTLKTTTDEYFASKNLIAFKVQTLNEGAGFRYVFTNSEINVEELKSELVNAIGTDVVVEVDLKMVENFSETQTLNVVLALLVASLVVTVYLLIVEKVAIAFTVLFNSVFGAVLAFALTALTRIPTSSYVSIFFALSYVLTAVLSVVFGIRFRERNNMVTEEKYSLYEIAKQAISDSKLRIIAFICIILLSAIVLGSSLLSQAIYCAGYLLIAGVSSLFVSVFGTLVILPYFKGLKK